MANYQLSKSADTDFEDIFIYGVLNFGIRQAEHYIQGLQDRLEQITQHPRLYPEASQLEGDYRYRLSVYRSHSIYYRADERGILIVRILRNQDVRAALAAELLQ